MLRLNTILVPFDSSPASGRALDEALKLACRTSAAVHILRVEVLHGDLPPREDAVSEAEKLRERVRHLADRHNEAPGAYDPANIRITHAVEREIAAVPAILRYAEDHDVDVVVMGTHGRRGLSRVLLGSVAEEVVRHAPCPVLTFHADEHGPHEAQPLESILVPIDFSVHARLALAYAHEWAALYGARLDLLHVIEDYLHPTFYNTGAFSIYDFQPDIEERAQEYLEAFYRESGGTASEVGFHVASGRAPVNIVDFAETKGSGLIIMATHGLTGLDRFLMGSVAEKVVRYAGRPVLTVKPFGKSLIGEPERTATMHAAT